MENIIYILFFSLIWIFILTLFIYYFLVKELINKILQIEIVKKAREEKTRLEEEFEAEQEVEDDIDRDIPSAVEPDVEIVPEAELEEEAPARFQSVGLTDEEVDIDVGENPMSLAVNPVTDKIYTVNPGSDDVTVIDGGGLAEPALRFQNVSSAEVSGFQIRNSAAAGIAADQSALGVAHVSLWGNEDGVRAGDGSILVVENSIIYANSRHGINADHETAALTVVSQPIGSSLSRCCALGWLFNIVR